NLMEKHELSIKDNTWVYPDEPTQFGGDFRKLGDALGWSIVRESYIHVASTTLTREVGGGLDHFVSVHGRQTQLDRQRI
ncbi:MAG: hypothetical protein L0Z53_21190, partial [Acidobacteriales bacterium]|nr:hypothetical protein [Terriglobales bacterium]